jgi:hypothetical protein
MNWELNPKTGHKEKKPITYQVDWIRNGWCYRTTYGVPKDRIKECRATAKALGEKIEITKEIY